MSETTNSIKPPKEKYVSDISLNWESGDRWIQFARSPTVITSKQVGDIEKFSNVCLEFYKSTLPKGYTEVLMFCRRNNIKV